MISVAGTTVIEWMSHYENGYVIRNSEIAFSTMISSVMGIPVERDQ